MIYLDFARVVRGRLRYACRSSQSCLFVDHELITTGSAVTMEIYVKIFLKKIFFFLNNGYFGFLQNKSVVFDVFTRNTPLEKQKNNDKYV